MLDARTVAIDSVSESPVRHSSCDAIVLVDVICDTTTLVTAAAQKRPVYPAASAPAALFLGRELREPLLAAEEDEAWRPGFELRNSPTALAARSDGRPLVLAMSADLAESTNIAGFMQDFEGVKGTGWYVTDYANKSKPNSPVTPKKKDKTKASDSPKSAPKKKASKGSKDPSDP